MTAKPAVSALLLSQNHAHFLAEAIESVLGQSRPDWEMVVVDNRSSDGSWDLIRQRARMEPRIKPILLGSKLSIPAALNVGLRQVSGRYIAPMDSDDSWLPQRLEIQMRFMEDAQNQGIGVCGTNCLLMDGESRVFATKEYPQSHDACRRAFWFRNPICHSAALVRGECLDLLGAYDEAFDLVQDLELWLRLGRRYRLANLPDHLTRIRISDANASLRFQRRVIAKTLSARRRAVDQYGYPVSPAASAAMVATWLAQWFPARLVRRVFNHLLVPYGRFLWREGRGRAGAEGQEAEGRGQRTEDRGQGVGSREQRAPAGKRQTTA
jgi:glycosyltransferase involved in cell wall biosynthesis